MSEKHPSLLTYVLVFLALMALLGVTVWAANLPYEQWKVPGLAVLVALTIASVKAVLVVLYFMHVRGANPLTKLFVFTSLAWLGILFALTLSDYLTRGWLPATQGWIQPGVIPPP